MLATLSRDTGTRMLRLSLVQNDEGKALLYVLKERENKWGLIDIAQLVPSNDNSLMVGAEALIICLGRIVFDGKVLELSASEKRFLAVLARDLVLRLNKWIAPLSRPNFYYFKENSLNAVVNNKLVATVALSEQGNIHEIVSAIKPQITREITPQILISPAAIPNLSQNKESVSSDVEKPVIVHTTIVRSAPSTPAPIVSKPSLLPKPSPAPTAVASDGSFAAKSAAVARSAPSTDYDEETLNSMTVVDLKDILRDLGLKVSGRKQELIDRILTPDEEDKSTRSKTKSPEPELTVDLDALIKRRALWKEQNPLPPNPDADEELRRIAEEKLQQEIIEREESERRAEKRAEELREREELIKKMEEEIALDKLLHKREQRRMDYEKYPGDYDNTEEYDEEQERRDQQLEAIKDVPRTPELVYSDAEEDSEYEGPEENYEGPEDDEGNYEGPAESYLSQSQVPPEEPEEAYVPEPSFALSMDLLPAPSTIPSQSYHSDGPEDKSDFQTQNDFESQNDFYDDQTRSQLISRFDEEYPVRAQESFPEYTQPEYVYPQAPITQSQDPNASVIQNTLGTSQTQQPDSVSEDIDERIREKLMTNTVEELKQVLRRNGGKVSGRKSELVDRIVQMGLVRVDYEESR